MTATGQAQSPIVTLLSVLLPLAALVGTCAAMRHRDASRKALLGLALFLLPWTVMTVLAVVTSSGSTHVESTFMGVVAVISAMLVMALMVASLVLSILGVVETYHEPERFRRGRKRGILAIVLIVLLFGAAAVSAIFGLSKRGAAAGQPVAVDGLNYRITLPRPWFPMDSKRLSPLASFAAVRADPQLFTMVLVEQSDPPPPLEMAATSIEEGLKATGSTFVSTRRSEKVNGYDGLLLETEHAKGGDAFFFTHWLTSQAGAIYRVVTWGAVTDSAKVREESLRVRQGFQIIDPRRAAPAGLTSEERYHSTGYGWSVDLKGTSWTRRWTNLAEDVPTAEWGVMNAAGTACFCVIPVWIGEEEAPLEAVTHGLAALVGLKYPDASVFGVKEIARAGPRKLSGLSFSWEGRRAGAEYLYRARVLRGQFGSYLLVAWYDKGRESPGDLLEETLDRVRFDPVSPMHSRIDRLSASEQLAHRLVFNGIGFHEQSRQHLEAAQEWFKRGYELGRSDVAILLNYVYNASSLGKAKEGQAYLQGELSRFPGNSKLAIAMADLQMAGGDVPAGLRKYEELFDSGFRDDAIFDGYVQAACEHGEAEAATRALDRYSAGHDSPRLRKLRAVIAQARHDFPGALAIFAQLRQENPSDVDTLSAQADCLFAAEQYVECIASCDRLLELGRDTAAVYRRKGMAQFALKRYPEAKEAMELAHRRDPADPEAKRLLDYLSGVLGQGANLAVKTPLDPVPLPEEMEAPELKTNDPYLRGFSACYRQCIRSIQYVPGQEQRRTEREVITVFDQQGVEAFNTLEIPFDPLAEEVYVNSVVVKDSAGREVVVAKVEDSYVVDEGGGTQVATQRKVLHVPVPGLQPGSTIETTVTRRETGSVKSFRYHVRSFARSLPVLRHTIVLSAPAGSVKWEASPGIAAVKWQGGLRWTVERPVIFRPEPQMDLPDKMLPMLWLADAGATWSSEAKEYLGLIKDRLPLEAAVREAAAEAVKGRTTRADKIAALAAFTQKSLTYKAVEFGRRALIPNRAAQTLTHRYGDCKDHALLLSQLLEAAGIPSELALISFSTATRAGLPSLDQFDHMIVHIPEGKDGTFLDCTSKSTDLASKAPPYGLATQTALILDAAHPRLETIPDYAPGSSGVQVEREIALSENGSDLRVQETVHFSGLMAAWMRGTLKNIQPAEHQRRLLEMLDAQIPSLDLQEAEVEQLDELHAPLVLKLRYLLRQRCQVVGDRLVGRLAAPWEHMLLSPTPLEKRHLPFRLWYPTTIDSRVRIAPPAGWEPVAPEKRRLEKPYCAGSLEARPDQRTLRLEAHLTQRTGEFPAEQYKAYVAAMTEAVGLAEQSLVFKKK